MVERPRGQGRDAVHRTDDRADVFCTNAIDVVRGRQGEVAGIGCHRAKAGGEQFCVDEEVWVRGADVQSVNGEDVRAGQQRTTRFAEVEVLKAHRCAVGMAGGGGRVPWICLSSVGGGGLDAVDVSDEAVVVFDTERETIHGRCVIHDEWDADVGRAVLTGHRRFETGLDQRRVGSSARRGCGLVLQDDFVRGERAIVEGKLVDHTIERRRGSCGRAGVIRPDEQIVGDGHRLAVGAGKEDRAVQERRCLAGGVAGEDEVIPVVVGHSTASSDEGIVIDADGVRAGRGDVNAEVAAGAFVSEEIAARRGVGGIEPQREGERAGAEIERGDIRDLHATRGAVEAGRVIVALESAEGRRTRPSLR